ncbi:hypothetical protein AcV5_005430 [Taiwanofungus camphoratus]|nr:hypothetical protein AcV5_005430 [Antrodia cinnamomea]KAI0929608.1 hypothetical protein AcV7_005097 [Antrodia cinnamomea]
MLDSNHSEHPPPPPVPPLDSQRQLDTPLAARAEHHDLLQSPNSSVTSVTAPASPPQKRIRTDPSPTQSRPFHLDPRLQFAPSLHPAHFYPPEQSVDHRMPHRVSSLDRTSSHHSDDSSQYQRMHSHPTPPPIATLHHSPAMSTSSLASSSISPSPPLSHPSTPYYQHAQAVPANSGVSYPYNPNPPLGARYGSDAINHSAHHSGSPYTSASHMVPGQVSTRSIRPSFIPSQPYPGQPMHVIHTDDAATKLSDRVRRKCYNCRTTDTSTWRRSSLTPGKVLCNKCGLFERTHSRPRPEQFPHKRGPLVTATFKSSRTPPPSSRLPPITSHMHALPPHHYSHPSIAPLMSRVDHSQNGHNASTLPEIRSLLNAPSNPQQAPSSHEVPGSSAQHRPSSPDQAPSSLGSPRTEHREAPAYRTSN